MCIVGRCIGGERCGLKTGASRDGGGTRNEGGATSDCGATRDGGGASGGAITGGAERGDKMFVRSRAPFA